MKFIATQNHVGRFGRFDEGQEIDTEEKGSPYPLELCEAAAEAGILKPAGKQIVKRGSKKAETAAKPAEAETR